MIWVSEGTIIVSVPSEFGRVVLTVQVVLELNSRTRCDDFVIVTAIARLGLRACPMTTSSIKLDVQSSYQGLNNPGVRQLWMSRPKSCRTAGRFMSSVKRLQDGNCNSTAW